jgi:hypothetical protein
MNFTDLIVEVPNAVPHDFCDKAIDFFEDCPEDHNLGKSGLGYDPSIKDSLDLHIMPTNPKHSDFDRETFQHLTKSLSEYMDFYTEKINGPWKSGRPVHVSDTGYQIQKTVKDGHYTWHVDYDVNIVLDTLPNPFNPLSIEEEQYPWVATKERIYTFIFYLNDGFKGGRTQFHFGGEIHSVVPEKGKLIWFPANRLYVHRGEPVESGEKYLMTGWIFDETRRRTVGSSMLSQDQRDMYGEENMMFSPGTPPPVIQHG